MLSEMIDAFTMFLAAIIQPERLQLVCEITSYHCTYIYFNYNKLGIGNVKSRKEGGLRGQIADHGALCRGRG